MAESELQLALPPPQAEDIQDRKRRRLNEKPFPASTDHDTAVALSHSPPPPATTNNHADGTQLVSTPQVDEIQLVSPAEAEDIQDRKRRRLDKPFPKLPDEATT
jgi:hypothetical protein